MAADRPALSVVVMGYRNESTIVEAVRSVLDQDATADFEVLVVTSGGDGSARRLRSVFPQVAVYESRCRLMPGGARNLGLEHSRGEFVAWLAADCLAAPGWVEARITAHRSGHVAVAAAVADHGWPWPWSRASHLLHYRTRLPGLPAADVPPGDPRCHGLSISRALLDEVGPFDPDLRIGEDTEMAARLMHHGAALRFEPDVIVVHRGPKTPWRFVADEWIRARRLRPPRRGAPRPSIRRQLRLCVAAGLRCSGDRSLVVWASAPFVVLGLLVRRLASWWPPSQGGVP